MADDSDVIGRLVREKHAAEDALSRAVAEIERLDEENGYLLNQVLSPLMAGTECYSTTELDRCYLKDIHCFRFPNPPQWAFSEPLGNLRDDPDRLEREKLRRRMRWRLARHWARHAFDVFDQHMAGTSRFR